MTRVLFDTNVLLYAFDSSDLRQPIAADALDVGGIISVQSFNEFAHVAKRKLRWDWDAIRKALSDIQQAAVHIVPLTTDLHMRGVDIAARYRIAIYDAMIVAAAMTADCATLYSEDMHDGLVVDGRLSIVNPFRAVTR